MTKPRRVAVPLFLVALVGATLLLVAAGLSEPVPARPSPVSAPSAH